MFNAELIIFFSTRPSYEKIKCVFLARPVTTMCAHVWQVDGGLVVWQSTHRERKTHEAHLGEIGHLQIKAIHERWRLATMNKACCVGPHASVLQWWITMNKKIFKFAYSSCLYFVYFCFNRSPAFRYSEKWNSCFFLKAKINIDKTHLISQYYITYSNSQSNNPKTLWRTTCDRHMPRNETT